VRHLHPLKPHADKKRAPVRATMRGGTTMIRASAVAAAIFLLGSSALPVAASADAYPTRPIRLVVPTSPGGGTDAIARILGNELTRLLGEQIVVDNRPGASQIIGAELVAQASPDGYTLLMGFISSLALSPALLHPHYDPLGDFTPISLVASAQYLMAAHPSIPAHTLKEFVAYAKAHPHRISYASAGVGTPLHLAGEMFKSMAGIDMVHVPYKGGGPAALAVLRGEAQVIFGSITSTLPHVKAGKLVGLAVTGERRSPIAPEYPTIEELGYPGFVVTSWYGIAAPAHTPRAVVDTLNRAILEALRAPAVHTQMARHGLDAIGSSPAEFGAFLKRENEKWARVVKAAHITAN
jgi:tripartite-type tricarboxylate transporter receptor subunit TctC